MDAVLHRAGALQQLARKLGVAGFGLGCLNKGYGFRSFLLRKNVWVGLVSFEQVEQLVF